MFSIETFITTYSLPFSAIKPEFRDLFSELCTEQILTQIRPGDIKLRKKQRKVGSEIVDLKMKLQNTSKNIVLSNREIRLLRWVFVFIIN